MLSQETVRCLKTMAIKTASDLIEEASPYHKKKKGPSIDFSLSYNSSSETLEPIYFWILDFMGGPDKVEKLVDNFVSSPGSGHFSELMGKATRMQEEGMKIMQTVGVLIKSLINIIYDLRQFEIKFKEYDRLRSDKESERESAVLALKQVWLDNVDIKRGNTSIKAMTFSQASFATLLQSFMAAKDVDSIPQDLNDIVKRLLKQRIPEFYDWLKYSEDELRKRYNVERAWLKSQVNSLKLYSRWAKPYLKAAEELTMSDSKSSAIVKAFNTITLELTLFKKSKFDVEQAIVDKALPKEFGKAKIRPMYSCVLVNLKFRGIPQKAGQHYVMGGRADLKFEAYTLNEEEYDFFKYKLSQSDLADALTLVEGATTESLDELREDIEHFLKPQEEREEEMKQEAASSDVNPFTALLGLDKLKKKKKKEDKEEKAKTEEEIIKEKGEKIKDQGIKKDTYPEKVIRAFAEAEAKNSTYKVYDIFKKGHRMASYPGPEFEPDTKAIY